VIVRDLAPGGHNDHDNEIFSIIKKLCETGLIIS